MPWSPWSVAGGTRALLQFWPAGFLEALLVILLVFLALLLWEARRAERSERDRDEDGREATGIGPPTAYGPSGTRDVAEVLEVPGADDGRAERPGEDESPGDAERSGTNGTTADPGGPFEHERIGERGRGLLVEVRGRGTADRFFVDEAEDDEMTVEPASPLGTDEGWASDAAAYLREAFDDYGEPSGGDGKGAGEPATAEGPPGIRPGGRHGRVGGSAGGEDGRSTGDRDGGSADESPDGSRDGTTDDGRVFAGDGDDAGVGWPFEHDVVDRRDDGLLVAVGDGENAAHFLVRDHETSGIPEVEPAPAPGTDYDEDWGLDAMAYLRERSFDEVDEAGHEPADEDPGNSSFDHEVVGDRARGQLVEVRDRNRRAEFFVKRPDSSYPTVVPASSRERRHGEAWTTSARRYLREASRRGEIDADRGDDADAAGAGESETERESARE